MKPLRSKSAATKNNKTSHTAKLPTSRRLIVETWNEISTFWRSLLGVLAVYIVLFFVITQGIAINVSVAPIREDIQTILGDQASIWSRTGNLFSEVLFANQLTPRDSATSFLQLLLWILATLALIWMLRQSRELRNAKIRDAYYKGTASFVGFALVLFCLALLSVPLSVASLFFGAALQYGSMVVIVVSAGINIAVFAATVYWYLCFWPALYIVSLGESYSIEALRKAGKITKKRRRALLWRIVILASLVALFFFGLLYMTALAIPALTLVMLLVLSFASYLWCVVYLYLLYRSLL